MASGGFSYGSAGPAGRPRCQRAAAHCLGKVRNDDDFVFYNQPRSADGSVTHQGKSGTSDSLEVDLAALPAAIENVAVAASTDGPPFGAVHGLQFRVHDAGWGRARSFRCRRPPPKPPSSSVSSTAAWRVEVPRGGAGLELRPRRPRDRLGHHGGRGACARGGGARCCRHRPGCPLRPAPAGSARCTAPAGHKINMSK